MRRGIHVIKRSREYKILRTSAAIVAATSTIKRSSIAAGIPTLIGFAKENSIPETILPKIDGIGKRRR